MIVEVRSAPEVRSALRMIWDDPWLAGWSPSSVFPALLLPLALNVRTAGGKQAGVEGGK